MEAKHTPSIYTVAVTADGYQPQRDGRAHFDAFPDYLSAHLACKAAENRQASRYLRRAAIAKASGQ